MRRSLCLALSALLAGAALISFGAPRAVAQDWSANDGDARRAEIVRRYREILERNPEEGRIFDMLLNELGGPAGIERLADDYAERLEDDPTDFAAAMLLGHLRKRLDRLEDALAAYEQARSIDPDSASVYTALGGVYRRLDRRAESEEMYESALELTPGVEGQRGILRALADLAFDAREWDAASAYVERIVALDPDNVDVRRELAGIYVRYERWDDALAQYEAIVDGAGRDTRQRAMAMADMGDVLALMGRTDEAVETFEDAMRLVERGYWLHRALEQRVIDAYRTDGRLAELVERFESEWTSPDFDQLLLLADLYDEIGRDDDALDAVRSAVRRNSRSIDARLALIRLLERRGEVDAVIEEYETLIRQAPNDASFVFRLVDLQRRLGDVDAALDLLDDASRRYASNPSALLEIADRYMRLRETERAGDIYERLVRVEPDEPLNYVALGDYHFMEGRRSEAERTWRTILEIVAEPSEAHALLGDVFSDHGLIEEAVIEYETARDLEPDNIVYLRSLAQLYEDADRLTQALRLWQELLDVSEQAQLAAEARTAIIRVYDGLGRLQEVVADFRDDFEAEPPDVQSGYLLGEALVHLDRLDDAEQVYLALGALDDTDLIPLLALERIYTSQNRLHDAIGVLTRVAELSPQRAREYYHRVAELSLRVYDDEQAIAFAELAVELNPDDASAHARLGDIYRQMQRLDEAIGAYRRALELDDRAFPHYFALADIFLALDRVDEADTLYLTVVSEASDEVQILRAGRRAIRIHQASGSLEELAAIIEPRVYEPLLGATYLKLLVELYDALTLPLAQTAEFGPSSEREAARQALDRVGRRALRPMLDALASEDLPMRTTALRILDALRNPAAALPVARLLDDPDSALRLQAALAVARMADARSVSALRRHAEQGTGVVATLAVWAAARTASTEASRWLSELAVNPSAPASHRALAVVGVGRAPATDAGDAAIRSALLDDSVDVRLAALWAVGARNLDSAAPDVERLLQHGRDEMPAAAAAVLAVIGDEGPTASALVEALFRVDEATRPSVGMALASPGAASLDTDQLTRFEDAMPFYSVSSEDFDARAYVRGLYSWSTLRGPEQGRLSDARRDLLRAELGRVLASSGPERDVALAQIARGDVEVLTPHLDEDGRRAVAAVVSAAATTAQEPLIALVGSSEDAKTRELAALALGRIEAPSSTVDAALMERTSDEDEAVVSAALFALGRRGADGAETVLATRLLDENWTVRSAAARALGELGAGGDALEAAFLDDPYLSVRIAALVAWTRVDTAAALARAEEAWPTLPASAQAALLAAAVELPAEQREALAALGAQSADARVRELAQVLTAPTPP